MTSSIPTIPDLSGNSPSIMNDVSIKKGVRARKGTVKDNGETLIAFTYRMMAVISKCNKINITIQKMGYRCGIDMKGSITRRKGDEYPSLTHAMIYSSLSLWAFLVRVSVVDRHMA